MQLDLDMPDMLEIQPLVVFELASIAVGGELYGIEAVPPLEARVACSFARLNTPEECFKGTVQPSQGRLRTREVGSCKERVRLSRFFELPRLLAVGDGAEFGLVCIPALLQGSVVQPAVRLKRCAESFRLRAVWIKPVAKSSTQGFYQMSESLCGRDDKASCRYPRPIKRRRLRLPQRRKYRACLLDEREGRYGLR